MLEHPGSCTAAEAITREDVRFVVLYRKRGQDADLDGFRSDRARYREVFENLSVVIYAPQPAPATDSVRAPLAPLTSLVRFTPPARFAGLPRRESLESECRRSETRHRPGMGY